MANLMQKDGLIRELVSKNELKRLQYKSIIKNQNLSLTDRYKFINKLNKLNRNSSRIRIKNRCVVTGRPKGIYSMFRLSRIKFRELAWQGLLPGVKKASW